jgi:hypothetical protein
MDAPPSPNGRPPGDSDGEETPHRQAGRLGWGLAVAMTVLPFYALLPLSDSLRWLKEHRDAPDSPERRMALLVIVVSALLLAYAGAEWLP